MALEDLVKELNATMKELSEATKNLVTLRTEAIEVVKTAAAPAAKATAKAAEKPAEKAPEPEVKAAAPTVDSKVYEEIAGQIAAYIGSTTRDDERKERKDWVKKLLQHDAIKKPGTPADVFDAANIKDDAIQMFKDNLAAKVAKGDITQPAAAGGLLD